MLFPFRYLLIKLPRGTDGPLYNFDDEVALRYYRLQKISEGSLVMDKTGTYPVDGPTEVGTGAVHKEEIRLSRWIDILNERFGTEFRPGDQLFFDSICEDAMADDQLKQAALANTMENFGFVFYKSLENLFIDRMDQNEEITAKFMNEDGFRKAVSKHLLTTVYKSFHENRTA